MHQRNLPHLLQIFQEVGKRNHHAIFAFDIDAKQFLYLNPAFERILDQPKEKFSANPDLLLKAAHPEEREYLSRIYREVIGGAEKNKIEFRIQLPGKPVQWICLTPYLVKLESGSNVVAGYFEDISKSKSSAENLRNFAAKKNSVLEILSHDLAGPLNNINGISALLIDELKKYENPDVSQMIAMIRETSERSIQLIRDFVNQEFLESKNSAFVKKRVDVVKKMKEIYDQYKNSENEILKKFSLKTSAEAIFVSIDDYKFSQVINNLISNAIKFTHEGGEIIISVEEKDDAILFSVADNGVGIPEKYHDTIFEKFTPARRKGLKGEPSVGLGMSIIKTIVEWHSGIIWFSSKENEGTTFFIEIPKE